MVAHSRLANIQTRGDLPILDAFADQLNDLALAISQLGDPQRLDILLAATLVLTRSLRMLAIIARSSQTSPA